MSNLRTISLISLLALLGCRSRQTGPDANYEKGSRIYQQLYATQLDDAYGDPKMNEAAELLQKVDPRSVDAESAQRMLASIETGRAALKKQRDARNKMAAAAAESLARQPQIDPQAIIAANAPPPPDDAGPEVDPFGPGVSMADLNAANGGCLTAGERFREQETNVTGTVYRVAKGSCAERLPGLVGQLVLVGADGRIYRRLEEPATLIKETLPIPDAGAAAARPDAGPARPKPPPPPPAAAQGGEDAGGQLYIPGMPMPEGMVPAEPPPADQQR